METDRPTPLPRGFSRHASSTAVTPVVFRRDARSVTHPATTEPYFPFVSRPVAPTRGGEGHVTRQIGARPNWRAQSGDDEDGFYRIRVFRGIKTGVQRGDNLHVIIDLARERWIPRARARYILLLLSLSFHGFHTST